MINQVLFGDVESILRILLATPFLYVVIVLFTRISGKRTTSQMNNFDWIVTVAIGSVFASGILSKEVSVADMVLAVGLLLGFQYLFTWVSIRSEKFENLVKATPRLLVYRGKFLDTALRKERVTKREVMAAVRENGIPNLFMVEAVVLETDASLSVIPKQAMETTVPDLLTEVKGFPHKHES